MARYILDSKTVEYYLKLIRDDDSRTIIVGLQHLFFFLEGGYIFLPKDKLNVEDSLCKIILSNKDARVRQWCYMLGSSFMSEKLSEICIRNLESETSKNKSWILALLSGNLREEQFLIIRKKAEHFLSKDVIDLSTYLFSNAQYERVDSDYVQSLISHGDDELTLLWLGWIATFRNQNKRSRGDVLINDMQMHQLTEFKDDNVLKHIMAAYSQRDCISVVSLGFDVFDYEHMESEHKKWTMKAIWKDKSFICDNQDYISQLLSRRHLFQLCDKRIREGLASGLSTFEYEEWLVFPVLEWFSNETEESVKHFLLEYMLAWQDRCDDYFEMLESVLNNGTETEKLLVRTKLRKRLVNPQFISLDFDYPLTHRTVTRGNTMLPSITLKRYIDKCDKVITSDDEYAAKNLIEEIISSLGSDLDGLKTGLTCYKKFIIGTNITTGENTASRIIVDHIQDIRTLRNRIQVELEKTEFNKMENDHMSNNSVNIYGNASGVQIQQATMNSNQMKDNYAINDSDVDKFQVVLDQIYGQRSQFEEVFGEKSDELIAALEQAQEALNKRDQSLWEKAIGVVKELATGAGGSLIATGILGLVTPLL